MDDKMKLFRNPKAMGYLLVAVAVLTRFIPHLPDFTPAFGALLFGGACLRRRDAVWYPVALMALSDVAMNALIYHVPNGLSQVVVWIGYASVALVGCIQRGRTSAAFVLTGALAAPGAFFLVSNFGVWLQGGFYPQTMAGLQACFMAGIPFFQNMLMSSLLASVLLFGAWAVLQKKRFEAQPAAR